MTCRTAVDRRARTTVRRTVRRVAPDIPPAAAPAGAPSPAAPAPRRHWPGFALAALLALAGIGTADAQAATETPENVVQAALRDTAQVFGQGQLSRAEASERLRGLIDHYVDLPRVGRDSLGAHWRHATPEQQAVFLALFENFLCSGYSGSVVKLGGTLEFGPTSVVERDDAVTVVRTEVQLADGSRHGVLFMVGRSDDGSYRIMDVVAAAISMSKLLSADFSAVLRTNGGQFDALIGALERKLTVTTP
jgi:phospholipid transport system substrate-binding protein